jgi:hypothetical protein
LGDRGIPGRIEFRALDTLHLDPENPRLPLDNRGDTQSDIAIFIERQYDALNVAMSIARHGYFASEALVVVRLDGRDTVVEGNRRLVALRGLTDADLRGRFGHRRDWEQAAAQAAANGSIPGQIPVVIAPSRIAVAPLIGYRHITGILPWDPFSQARYVAQLVDEYGLDFDDVASQLGEQLTVIRSRYRNFKIVEQARGEFHLDVANAESDFGVLTRALQSQGVREFIGAPQPAGTRTDADPIPIGNGPRVAQLFTWLFGDDEGTGRVIGESRDINDLGRVLASHTGREVLEETGDLAAAVEAIGGIRDRLTSRLNTALRALLAAKLDIDAYYGDPEVQRIITDLDLALAEIKGAPGG